MRLQLPARPFQLAWRRAISSGSLRDRMSALIDCALLQGRVALQLAARHPSWFRRGQLFQAAPPNLPPPGRIPLKFRDTDLYNQY